MSKKCFKLVTKDKKLMKNKKVLAWLRQCEEKIQLQILEDTLFTNQHIVQKEPWKNPWEKIAKFIIKRP